MLLFATYLIFFYNLDLIPDKLYEQNSYQDPKNGEIIGYWIFFIWPSKSIESEPLETVVPEDVWDVDQYRLKSNKLFCF